MNERHFERLSGMPSKRHARRPRILADEGSPSVVVFPRKGRKGANLTIELEFLKALPNLAPDLTAAVVRHWRWLGRQSIRHHASWLREWCRFMALEHAGIDFAELDRGHLVAFRAWLDAANASNAARRSKKTRSRMIRSVQVTLQETRRCQHVEMIKRPYKSVDGGNLRVGKRKEARPVPPTGELRRLLRAVLVAMEETMTLRAAFLDEAHPANQDPAFAARLSLARHLHSKFGVIIPAGSELRNVRTRNVHQRTSLGAALPAIMPTLESIAPFCIFLMIVLRLDGQMLRLANGIPPRGPFSTPFSATSMW